MWYGRDAIWQDCNPASTAASGPRLSRAESVPAISCEFPDIALEAGYKQTARGSRAWCPPQNNQNIGAPKLPILHGCASGRYCYIFRAKKRKCALEGAEAQR